jgi:hypothetical protein
MKTLENHNSSEDQSSLAAQELNALSANEVAKDLDSVSVPEEKISKPLESPKPTLDIEKKSIMELPNYSQYKEIFDHLITNAKGVRMLDFQLGQGNLIKILSTLVFEFLIGGKTDWLEASKGLLHIDNEDERGLRHSSARFVLNIGGGTDLPKYDEYRQIVAQKYGEESVNKIWKLVHWSIYGSYKPGHVMDVLQKIIFPNSKIDVQPSQLEKRDS